MSGSYRLSSGGQVDRSRPVAFTFDGRRYRGFKGDTLASALLANGVSIAGRSFKLHRPRGIMSAGIEEANAIVDVGRGAARVANLKATEVDLTDGLVARSVNAWPSAALDASSVLGLMKPFFPSGFYYKTFIRPGWGTYEGFVRRAAGLGQAPLARDPDIYDKQFAHADVVVIGAGLSGLVAAFAASAGGSRVLVIDDQNEPGGRLLGQRIPLGESDASAWLANATRDLIARDNVTLLTRTTATGLYDHNFIVACERLGEGPIRQRLWKIRAKAIVLATGAIERPIVFPGNDRPGVMLADSARAYAERFGVASGRAPLFVTNNDSAYLAAIALKNAGVTVRAIADLRDAPPAHARDAAARHDIEIFSGRGPLRTQGRRGVSRVSLARVDDQGRLGNSTVDVDCDALCVSGGWSPALHLFAHSGGKTRFDAARGAIVPVEGTSPVLCAGAANGTFSIARSISEAYAAGLRAADAAGFKSNDGFTPPSVTEWPQTAAAPIAELRPPKGRGGQSWVDLQNDVTAADIRLAARENYRSVEHLKRYTTLGMAVDQGKTSNVNAIAIMAAASGRAMDEVGTTRFRPPYTPTTFGAFAGRETGAQYRPLRRLPAHDAHTEFGAVMEDYGGWQRPAFYPRPGEDEAAAIRREVTQVRAGVGIFDASTLGKIEVRGPDAATFLNRAYVNNVLTLGAGRARYGLMLDEFGIIKDDGILARICADAFLVGTTSANAGAIGLWLEEWHQCEWPSLKLTIAPVTQQWAVVTVTGPHARALVQRIACDINLSHGAFPHMSVREGTLAGVPTRIHRVSYTGEPSYEIAVPARYGDALWRLLAAEGRDLGVTPLGIEAQNVMRIEKGLLHIGSDTDGTTMPQDVGFAAIMAKKDADFIGRRSTQLPTGRDARREFVGLEVADGGGILPMGAHAVDGRAPVSTRRSQGWVTSTCMSPTLGRPVALALIENGRARLGETITLAAATGTRRARIAPSCAFDPEGVRLYV